MLLRIQKHAYKLPLLLCAFAFAIYVAACTLSQLKAADATSSAADRVCIAIERHNPSGALDVACMTEEEARPYVAAWIAAREADILAAADAGTFQK